MSEIQRVFWGQPLIWIPAQQTAGMTHYLGSRRIPAGSPLYYLHNLSPRSAHRYQFFGTAVIYPLPGIAIACRLPGISEVCPFLVISVVCPLPVISEVCLSEIQRVFWGQPLIWIPAQQTAGMTKAINPRRRTTLHNFPGIFPEYMGRRPQYRQFYNQVLQVIVGKLHGNHSLGLGNRPDRAGPQNPVADPHAPVMVNYLLLFFGELYISLSENSPRSCVLSDYFHHLLWLGR